MARLLRGVCLIAWAICVFGFNGDKELPEFELAVPLPTLSSPAKRVLGKQLIIYKKAVDDWKLAVDEDEANDMIYNVVGEETRIDNLFKSLNYEDFRDGLQAEAQGFEEDFIRELTATDIENMKEVYWAKKTNVDLTNPDTYLFKDETYANDLMKVADQATLSESPTWWRKLIAKIKKFIPSKFSNTREATAAVEKFESDAASTTESIVERCGSMGFSKYQRRRLLAEECPALEDKVTSTWDDIDLTTIETADLDTFLTQTLSKTDQVIAADTTKLESEATQYVNKLWADKATPALLSPEMKELFEASGETDEGKFMSDYFLKAAQKSVDDKYAEYVEYKNSPDSADLTFKEWNKRNDDPVAKGDDDLNEEDMDAFDDTELTEEAEQEGAKFIDAAVSERADAAVADYLKDGALIARYAAEGGEAAGKDMLKEEMGNMLEKFATEFA